MESRDIQSNVLDVLSRIGAAARRAGRSPKDIVLIAVTKTFGFPEVQAAVDAGVTDFGENRAQELVPKADAFGDCRWHFIGRLQTNKVKDVLPRAVMVHSLDRIELAREIEKKAAQLGVTADCLCEVNVSMEASKAGQPPQAMPSFLSELASMPHIRIRGLMTVAPYSDDPEEARPVFAALRELSLRLKGELRGADNISMEFLSMGMSGDFEQAVEEGATHVRVGSALFGTRPRL